MLRTFLPIATALMLASFSAASAQEPAESVATSPPADDHAHTPLFRSGFDRLRALGTEQRVVIMCAEAVWWRCHRRIITDYLLAAGETVFHILAPGKVDEARMTPAASPVPGRGLAYPS